MTDDTANRNRDALAEGVRALIRQDRIEEALRAAERALQEAPYDPALWQLRGVAIRRHPAPDRTPLASLQRALLLAPAGAGAWAELSLTRHLAGDPALDRSLLRAFACAPESDAVCDLALRLRGGSAAIVKILLAIRPDRAAHHHATASLAQAMGRERAARDGFRRTLCLEPAHTGAIRRLDRDPLASPQARSRLRWIDRLETVAKPREALWLRATGAQPSLLVREADGRDFADRQHRAIEALDASPETLASETGAGPVMTFTSAYWGIDNTALLRAAGALNSRLFASRYGAPASANLAGRAARSRPSVGIVTAHGYSHSVWAAIGSDWVAHLAATDAHVTLYDIYGLADSGVGATVQSVVAGPRPIQAWAETLQKAGHDILMYPEIGMDPATLTLASLRLAPLQVASWGHPMTTGLPTVDRYLSAERFETTDAEAHYTERLIRLPGVGVRIRPDLGQADAPDLAELGLTAGEAAVALVQTVFKYTPAFDALLARIAREEPAARFFVFASGSPDQVAFWRHRVSAAFAVEGVDADTRIRLLPARPMPAFRRLLAAMDAYLDPPGFSGYNTGLRAIETGCPLVTLEGPRLRHRLAAGLLREADAAATVATDPEGYIETVLRLIRDPAFRAYARAAQRAGLDRLTCAGDGREGRADLRAAFLKALGLI